MQMKSILIILTVLFLMAGCISSRNDYYSNLKKDRIQSANRLSGLIPSRTCPEIKGTLTLNDAVDFALSFNPLLSAAEMETKAARGRVIASYSHALPTIAVNGTYTRLNEAPSVEFQGMSFALGYKDNYSAGVTVIQPLLQGGRAFIARKAARIYRYYSDEKIREILERVLYQTATNYYRFLVSVKLVQVESKGLDSAKKHLRSVQLKKDNGKATQYDVLRARVNVANFEARLIEQKNRRDEARRNLLKVMGVSQQSRVTITGDVNFTPVKMNDQTALFSAMQNRPDLLKAELEIKLQKQNIKSIYTRYAPQLNGFFSHTHARPDPRNSSSDQWGSEWQAGIRLTWLLFDGLNREGELVEEKAHLAQLKEMLRSAEQTAALEVKSAQDKLHHSATLVASQKLNLKRADLALELVRAGYKEGVKTELDIIDATLSLTQARAHYHTALFEHKIAILRLQKAMGVLCHPPGKENALDKIGLPLPGTLVPNVNPEENPRK